MLRKPAKAAAVLLCAAMLLSAAACSTVPSDRSEYSLQNIKLTETERSWSNPEERYADLLETYGGQKCTGTMAVATDEDIVYLYCEDDVEKDGTTLVSQDTVFDIASISKMFTAVCILQLAEKGKLSVDDTIDKYFPEYEKGKDITIYNLLHMTSGISDYLNNPDPFWNISGADAANKKISDILLDKTTDKELLEAMYQAPLEFEPGEKVSYSNTNYRLLAFIIEQLTDKKYCDYVKKNIFDKCGMKKTTSMATGDMTYVPGGFDELVKYGFCDENGYPACPNNSRGDGGIHSCLTDMVAFDRALFGGKLLSEASMEILLNDDDTGYCCGLKKEKNGYSHDGSSMTCSGNNKIIESEEYGHVYVITLVHTGRIDDSVQLDDPIAGTNYTRGVFENGVYTNECAGLKLTLPEGFELYAESTYDRVRSESVAACETENDRLRESATKWDSIFYRAEDDYIYNIFIQFVNTELAAPENADYSVNEYLDDTIDYCEPEDADILGERVTVRLGGKEYVKQYYAQPNYNSVTYYVRRLDDRLLLVIDISVFNGDELAPEDNEEIENFFGSYDAAASDPESPMYGTNYTKGRIADGVYVNDYAELKLNVPEGFNPMSDSNMEMSQNNALSDITDEKDKTREAAKTWDIVLIGNEDIIEIDILNTKLGVPDDTDYTADDYLDDYEDYELRMVPGYMKPQVDKKRVTVELGGKEYVRDLVVLNDGGDTGNLYSYARKLDDELMCIINIAIWSDKTPEEYEALFG